MFTFWVHYNLKQINQKSTLHIILPKCTTCFEPKKFLPKWHYILGHDLTFFNINCEKKLLWCGCNTFFFSYFNFVVKLVFQVFVIETQNFVKPCIAHEKELTGSIKLRYLIFSGLARNGKRWHVHASVCTWNHFRDVVIAHLGQKNSSPCLHL